MLAGGVALNCVANSRLWREGPFSRVWVQPASGDSGTALGAALQVAHELGDTAGADAHRGLGRGWDEAGLDAALNVAGVEFTRPDDIADAVAAVLADNGVVAWFQGRSEFGPRALGHRSLLADPRRPENLEKLNDIKGREQFRPVAPMVLAERATEIFRDGPIPSPYMLFTHGVHEQWRDRIPGRGARRRDRADPDRRPRRRAAGGADARVLRGATGVPVVVNTSLNTAGRPMVDDPRDALECFGSCPVDALAIGPFLLRRSAPAGRAMRRSRELRDRHPDVRPCVAGDAARRDRAAGRDRRRRPPRPVAAAARRAAAACASVRRARRRGPAAARNAGWRAARAEWVAFLDDDVCRRPAGARALEADLRAAG